MRSSVFSRLLGFGVVLVLAACGGNSTSGPSTGSSGSSGSSGSGSSGSSTAPTSAQVTEIEALINTAFAKEFSTLSTAIATTATGSGTIPISGTAACTNSGSAAISGSVGNSVNPTTGSGSENVSITTTLNNCADSNLTMNGSVTTTGAFTFVGFVPQSPATLTTSGSITYSGAASGTATFACSTSINVTSGTFTNSGNVTFSGGVTAPCSQFGSLG